MPIETTRHDWMLVLSGKPMKPSYWIAADGTRRDAYPAPPREEWDQEMLECSPTYLKELGYE